ncbi:hypothetical protein [Actinomadura luteofluorescens]|uniref:hypothetical protein n=1 Tax=Actinomadura luteofluorescens TaxID=46163 RepID=UPI003D8AEDB9
MDDETRPDGELVPRPLDDGEPPSDSPPPGAATKLRPAPPDDLAELAPEEASTLESDPRIAAAAQRPENVQDILAQQSRSDRGVDGRGQAPYGDAELRAGPVKPPSRANPLTGQRAAGASENGENSSGGVKKVAIYQAREEANKRIEPAPGRDSLVIPRLAPRPSKEINVPVDSLDSDAWSRLGTSESVALPLQRVAVEYAWFFGGVIPPFDSAGKSLSGTPLSPSTPVYQGGDGSAAKVISVATSLIGTGGQRRPRQQPQPVQRRAWCADFVSWVIDKAGATKAYWNSPTGTPAHRWGASGSGAPQAGPSPSAKHDQGT